MKMDIDDNNDFLAWVLLEICGSQPKFADKVDEIIKNVKARGEVYDPRNINCKLVVEGVEFDSSGIVDEINKQADEYFAKRSKNIDEEIKKEARKIVEEKYSDFVEKMNEMAMNAENLSWKIDNIFGD